MGVDKPKKLGDGKHQRSMAGTTGRVQPEWAAGGRRGAEMGGARAASDVRPPPERDAEARAGERPRGS